MNRKTFALAVTILLATAVLSWARPPLSVDLLYDAKAKVLKVSIKHPSNNPRKHFIHRIYIYKNKEEPVKYFYNQQTSNEGLDAEIPLELKSKDTIRVKAFCIDAGQMETELSLP